VNVTTLGDPKTDGRAELAMDTLDRYGVDICGLSEVRWAGSGRLRVAGYDIFYSGSEKGGMYGVGIAIRSKLAESVSAWEPVSDRLMWVRFNAENVPTTFVQAYAPTDVADSDTKDDFYHRLGGILRDVPGRDFLVLLGDLNARVGNDDKTWKGIVGRQGVAGEPSDNGRRLLNICASYDLSVSGTYFQHRDIHKYTWYQRGKIDHVRSQIDHIIVRRSWLHSIYDTRVYRGADFCNSDHRLVVSDMRIRMPVAKRPKRNLIDLERLRRLESQLEFELKIANRFESLSDEVLDTDEEWTQLKEAVVQSATEVCGTKKRKKPVWLSDDVEQLSEKKASLFAEWQSSRGQTRETKYEEYRTTNRACIKATKKAKRSVWARKGKELEEEARLNNTRAVYQKLNELEGKASAGMDLLRDVQGSLIRSVEERRLRWKEHFEGLLNVGPQHVTPNVTPAPRPSNEGNEEELVPSEADVERAIERLKNGKAAGCDRINAEMLKAGGGVLVKWVHRLIRKIWQDEVVPEDWRKAVIVPLHKKGDKSVCDNWRGISLLSVAGKVFTHILLERLVEVVDGKISETQAGFRKARGCADQIFTLRRVMEQARDKRVPLFMCFIDLKAAYDTVRRNELWIVLKEYGVSSKLCRLLRSLYAGTQSAVRVEGELTDWFEVKTGLRQGCLLSPILFNVFIDRVVKRALAGMGHGVRVEYRLPDGRVHLGDHVRGSFKVFDLLYADDLVLICESAEVMQEAVMRLEQATQDVGLTINVKKTKYLITKVDGRSEPDVDLQIRGDKVERVGEFVYLGSSINEDSACGGEVERRIALGTRRFCELKKPIWRQDCIGLRTKMQLYRSLVLTVVLYGSESLTCSERDYASLNTFHNKNLRSLLGKRRDEIRNEELYKLTGSCPIEAYVRKYRLRWAGHVRRMEPDRIPKRVLFGELAEGKRARGRPKKNWMACLEEDWSRLFTKMKSPVPAFSRWTAVAEPSPEWRQLISCLTP
jgi:exonuclease III